MGWAHEPFTVPDEALKPWRAAGRKGAKVRKSWEAKLAASPQKAEFDRAMAGERAGECVCGAGRPHRQGQAEKPAAATRQHSGAALAELVPTIPEMVGGSADLDRLQQHHVKGMGTFDLPDYAGRYVPLWRARVRQAAGR